MQTKILSTNILKRMQICPLKERIINTINEELILHKCDDESDNDKSNNDKSNEFDEY